MTPDLIDRDLIDPALISTDRPLGQLLFGCRSGDAVRAYVKPEE